MRKGCKEGGRDEKKGKGEGKDMEGVKGEGKRRRQ